MAGLAESRRQIVRRSAHGRVAARRELWSRHRVKAWDSGSAVRELIPRWQELRPLIRRESRCSAARWQYEAGSARGPGAPPGLRDTFPCAASEAAKMGT